MAEQSNRDLTRIGSMAPFDLIVLAKYVGMEDLPFPFLGCDQRSFGTIEECRGYEDVVISSYLAEEERCINRWFASYLHADIWVECVTQLLPMLAHRQGQAGYFAVQRSDDFAIDVYSVSPYNLGSAIAAGTSLTKPGGKDRVVLPGMPIPALAEQSADSGGFSISHTVAPPTISVLTAPYGESTVQSRHQPARERWWDFTRPRLNWVSVDGDGDYIVEPGGKYFMPMSRQALTRRIDELIASDVKAVRAARGLD